MFDAATFSPITFAARIAVRPLFRCDLDHFCPVPPRWRFWSGSRLLRRFASSPPTNLAADHKKIRMRSSQLPDGIPARDIDVSPRNASITDLALLWFTKYHTMPLRPFRSKL